MKPRPDDPQCWCDDCEFFRYHRAQGRIPRLTLTEHLHNLDMCLTAIGHEVVRASRIEKAAAWLTRHLPGTTPSR
jgi:hypothetical protein